MSRPHLYIVDDDLNFGRSLKRLLIISGFPADYFGSAKSFLDSVPAGQEGVAVIDLHMPECDGFELMEKMRELRYEMPVIVVTGQSYAYSRTAALKRGAVGFLQKPFNEQSLLEMIEEHETEEGAK
jgi:two-component system response regulator FixJ